MIKLLKTCIIFSFLVLNNSYSNDTPYYNFGIRAGLNLSAFDSQSGNISINPAISFCTSGYYTNIFYLNMGISYIIRSGSLNDIIVLTPPYDSSTPIYKWDYKLTISYFQFSLRAGFYIVKDLSILVGAGTSFAGLKVSEGKKRKSSSIFMILTTKNLINFII